MYNARDTAKYILKYCNENNVKDCSNKKLQKLLYYVQAWSLAFTGKALFSDPIEAWLHGPVVADIYRKYKEFGFNPIPISAVELIGFSENYFSDKTDMVNSILSHYTAYDADFLEMRTHIEAPWKEARQTNTRIITEESMERYYKEVLQTNA